MSNIVTEVQQYNITTSVNEVSRYNYIPYIIPHLIPGDGVSEEINISTEVTKINITTQSDG
jgi:hypothetical protein